MRIRLILLFLFSITPLFISAQIRKVDSLKAALNSATTDSVRFIIADLLSKSYVEKQWETAMQYTDLMATIARRNNHHYDEADALEIKAYYLRNINRFPESLVNFQKALRLAETSYPGEIIWAIPSGIPANQVDILANIHQDIALLMGSTNNLAQQIVECGKARAFAQKAKDTVLLGYIDLNFANVYLTKGKFDSALLEARNAEKIFINKNVYTYFSTTKRYIGQILIKKNQLSLARAYFYEGVRLGIRYQNIYDVADCYNELAQLYISAKQKDSALFCAKESLHFLKDINGFSSALEPVILENISQAYMLYRQPDSSYKYLRLALRLKDKIDKMMTNNLTDFEKLSFKTQEKLQQLEQNREKAQFRARTWGLIAGLIVVMVIAAIFYRNNLQRKKANKVLNNQKKEIEVALVQLKAAQTQIIQSEKMASLGELTAGIAHEIQNPLNFVNNFSEVSVELLEELKEEAEAGNKEDVLAIADDLTLNLQKINHHGKRADFIVKGMLQHSRTSTGERQLTDINVLADEFLKLSYHGLRAKDKNFNAELITDFEEELPKINIVQQDIGRVLLNLFNNAFYAVNEKKKTAGPDYQPEVTVSTSAQSDGVIIKVKDNGPGIPDAIKDKIMQPFFTTKPTGEGTGLGLSLSYDIVVKGHGGKMMVKTKEGEFTELVINLPV